MYMKWNVMCFRKVINTNTCMESLEDIYFNISFMQEFIYLRLSDKCLAICHLSLFMSTYWIQSDFVDTTSSSSSYTNSMNIIFPYRLSQLEEALGEWETCQAEMTEVNAWMEEARNIEPQEGATLDQQLEQQEVLSPTPTSSSIFHVFVHIVLFGSIWNKKNSDISALSGSFLGVYTGSRINTLTIYFYCFNKA